jgi:hypothetical protein
MLSLFALRRFAKLLSAKPSQLLNDKVGFIDLRGVARTLTDVRFGDGRLGLLVLLQRI